jgi:RHS repeat-associated protein
MGCRGEAGGHAWRIPRETLWVVIVAIIAALLAPSAASATVLPETISENMTLTPAGSPYTGSPTIESGVTVTIEPGVKLTLGPLTVKGTLLAEGTAESPVAFTSAKEEKGGEWRGILFEPGSGASVLNHTEIKYAGNGLLEYGAVEVNASSPTIKNSVVRKSASYGIRMSHGGSPEIANNSLYNNGASAISYTSNTGDSGDINIHGNYVEGGGYGILVNVFNEAKVTGTTLSGNTVIGTEGDGLKYNGSKIPGDITENTLKENLRNYIVISGTVASSTTWNDGGSKVKVENEVIVASGVTLKITRGVYMVSPNFVVKGTLLAEGTAEDPIIFTGPNQEKAGEWKSVLFEPGSGASVLNHVEVKYGGSSVAGVGAVEVNASSPTIENSTIRRSGSYGIRMSHGGSPEVANNSLYNNGDAAISYTSTTGESGEVNIHGNFVEGGSYGIQVNVFKEAKVTGTTLTANTVIGTEGTGVKYTGSAIPGGVTENTLSGNATNFIVLSGTVASSSTWNDAGSRVKFENEVTVASGVTLKITKGVHLISPKMIVNGTLIAEGTVESPIIFTGAKEEKGGEWKNILFEPGSGASVLNHVEVKYGGNGVSGAGAVEVNASSPTIENSTILKSASYGIRMSHAGSPVVANNTVIESGDAAISYTSTTGESGDVNIHDNDVIGGGYGIQVNVFKEAKVTGTNLGGNTVIGTEGVGLTYKGSAIPGNVTENTLSGNATNYIVLSGTVAKSSTWNNGGSKVKFENEVTVASGVTLKITKGVYMMNATMIVKGTLLAEGTQEEPVVFTSVKQEAPGGWKSIKLESSSGSSVIDHAEVSFGGSGTNPMIEVLKVSPRITHTTLRKSGNAGIKVTESGAPTIEHDRFVSNGSGLTYSGTGKLSATHNDWGCDSFPKPSGCGDSVTTNVDWKPSEKLPELNGPCRGKESQCGEGADPVGLATGALNYSHRDLLLTNKGKVPLQFTRSYNSANNSDGDLGTGWSQSGLASATELESGEVLVVRQDGRQDLFTKTESGYKAPSGVTDKLSKVEGTFKLTTLQNTVYAFDSSGRISSITDNHGLKTTYAYSSEGRLSTITDPSAQTLTFTYNSSNHITVVKDSTGREVKYAYSEAGDLEKVTDALGGVTKYAYDANHRITSITDPRGNVILKNTYDSQGRITEQEDGLGNIWKLKYSPSETIVTEPQGGKKTYGFDSQNRVVSETDQLGHKTAKLYDAAGNVSEIIRPGGAKWTFGHDAAGNLTSIKDPEGGKREYEFDAQNRLTSYTDARGNTWKYEWSKANDLTKITDPEGGEITLTYNESGQPLTLTDPDKHKTEFSYDGRGNRLSVTDPLGHKTSFEYNSRNYLTAKTLPGLKAESYERDALGDMLARMTPEGNKTKYAYDANGLRTQITDPAENVWKIERNAMERPTVYTDPLEQQIKISYNGNLKRTKVTNRRGKITTYGYDAANHLTEVDRPEGEDWAFGYDVRGNRSSMIDPRGYETTYEYDSQNRMIQANEPLEVTTEYGYDANSNLTSVTDPLGHKTSYAYDKLGRLIEVAQPLEKTTKYSYDAAGNRLSKTTAAGTLEYGYDAANRLTSIKSGGSTLRSYGYDETNRPTGATDAEGHKIEIGYNGEGLVTSIKDGRGQSITRSYNSRGLLTKQEDGRGTIEYGYDKLGRETSLTDPQGKALSFGYDPEGDLTEVTRPSGVTTANVYNEAGRFAETTSKAEGGAVLEALKYAYDAEGNVTSRKDTRAETETTYAYDKLGRLTEFNPPGEGSTTYGYDKAGNRTEAGGTTYEFNALNQLVKASDGTAYGYDKAGRMTSKESEAGKTSYEWDLFDHLAKAEGPSETASYAYDALERLNERKAGGATQIVHYGDLSDMPTYDANGEGKTMTSYLAGPRGLLEERSAEATSFPLADAHGDITAITGPTGSVESRQSYDPWGTQLSGPSQEMGFLGAYERPTDPATVLIQMGARSYSPSLGSFMTEDPVFGRFGIGLSADRYLYVWDNPVNRYDLNGREVCIPSPFGTMCPGQDIEEIEQAGETILQGDEEASDWISDRANDFVKYLETHTFGVCVNGAGGAGVGLTAQLCVAGNLDSVGVAASLGGGAYLPFGAEAGAGPLYSNAHSTCELGGPFASGGVGAGEGVRAGVNGAVGTTKGNRIVNVYHPWLGVGVGPPISGNAGVSNTWAPCVSW